MIDIRTLQTAIGARDSAPERFDFYILKLMEEFGELARAIRQNPLGAESARAELKGGVGEELYDVIYYCLVLANLYDIDLSEVAVQKERLNAVKYGREADEWARPVVEEEIS